MKKFSYRHFHNASKECFWPKKNLNFMHGFKSAILAIFNKSDPLFSKKFDRQLESKRPIEAKALAI